MTQRRNHTVRFILFLVTAVLCWSGSAFGQAEKPNIPVIWGDDIGT